MFDILSPPGDKIVRFELRLSSKTGVPTFMLSPVLTFKRGFTKRIFSGKRATWAGFSNGSTSGEGATAIFVLYHFFIWTKIVHHWYPKLTVRRDAQN